MQDKILKQLLAVVACVFVITQNASAVLMNSWSLDHEYRENGNEKVGWIAKQEGTISASFVHISSEWGITAAHVIDVLGFNDIEVGFGPNFFADPITTRTIDSVIMFPDWKGWDGTWQTTDLALVHYAEPVYDLPCATIATHSPSIGDAVTGVGYGTPGVYGSNGAYDGIQRGFDVRVDGFGDSSHEVSDNYIRSVWRRPSSGGFPLGGRGTSGDSGGGLFSSNNDDLLFAIMVGVSNTNPIYLSSTYSIGLWHDDVRSWIIDTTGSDQTPVPEPCTLLLFGTGCGILLLNKTRTRK